ncbi:phosphatidylinositol-specific phospholipase C/glycerophosphodiester phosphodiesterase family protein [Paenibacillus pinihumi]|uniref:phosphatidylinositol-specific phospholipase C/glycerophosphodiester phosphodiesterase family protein n=1 Tax=Paenibacillus pinihumi TaxID=669462 RepID=UPI0003FC2C1C|nr:phosphatidylinositol-specific phospholipase C/glycerophosphodiester phosphodiesterase family protein [Paenibacillus pinihumi]
MYKKSMRLSLLIAVCLIWFGWGMVWSAGTPQAAADNSGRWKENEWIAHALGGIQGSTYTNSYEAFMTNYHKGHRLFEVDLLQTTDGDLVARHDWSGSLQPDLAELSGRALTLPQFESSLIRGHYRPLSFPDILDLMQKYPDFYLITDTKETDRMKIEQQFITLVQEARAVDPALLDRIIPEIYSPEMYDAVMSIYPFPNKMYSIYKSAASAESIVEFVKEKQFTAVAMPVYRVFLNPNLVHALNQSGVQSYVHTVNSVPYMKLLQGFGVHGFYTDSETPPTMLADEVAEPPGPASAGYMAALLFSISTIIMKVKK